MILYSVQRTHFLVLQSMDDCLEDKRKIFSDLFRAVMCTARLESDSYMCSLYW